jgi:hypothetical protein
MEPLAQAIGALHQAVSYRWIAESVEPGSRWQYGDALPYFLRVLLS